jgi:hypothetical protein
MDDMNLFFTGEEYAQQQESAAQAQPLQPDLMQVLLTMQSQFQQQQQQMQQQLLTLTQALAASHSSPPTPKFKLKHQAPDAYDGNRENSQFFLTQLKQYFHNMGVTDEAQMVSFALSLCKVGSAASWARAMYKEMEKREQPTWASDWEIFTFKFLSFFEDPNPAATAIFKLKQLKQGSGSVKDYNSQFQILMVDTGFNDPALVDLYKRGIHPSLVDKIFNLPSVPTTLMSWMEYAARFDTNWKQRQQEKENDSKLKSSSSTSHSTPSTTTKQSRSPPTIPFPGPFSSSVPSPSAAPPTQPRQSFPIPMEVDSTWRRQAKPFVCFKCRKPGHKAADCKATFNISSMDYGQLYTHFTQLQKQTETAPSLTPLVDVSIPSDSVPTSIPSSTIPSFL